jgi:hypothetical protein
MIVQITRELTRVTDANDCTRLHVEAPDLDDEAVGEALAVHRMGRAGEPGQVWLDVGALRRAARAAASVPGWDTSFDAMLGYAGTKGWLDATGRSVAAHIERSTS